MSNRKGFTLIELLIVVVIIGILAAIAIPKFANTKSKAYITAMKSDLRNLVTAEEAFFADSAKYTATITQLKFSSTTGVNTPSVAGAPQDRLRDEGSRCFKAGCATCAAGFVFSDAADPRARSLGPDPVHRRPALLVRVRRRGRGFDSRLARRAGRASRVPAAA